MYDIIYGVVLLFEVCFSSTIGLLIIKRDRFQRLNQIFSLVMFSFVAYLFLESVIYLFNITDLFVINLLRDIGVTFSTSSAVLLGFSAMIIQRGDEVVNRKINLVIVGFFILFLVIFGAPFDTAEVVEYFGITYIIFQEELVALILLRAVPLLCVSFAIFQYMKIRVSSEDSLLRQRLLKLTIGLLLIMLGVIYFSFFPFFLYPGHVSYIIGELCVFWAFK
ncbi:MAG: hypothetical protein ACFFBD_08495 [Candidatus Hodarchaeota archaeon]